MVDGCTLSTNQSVTAATNKGWQYYVGLFLKQHSQQLFHSFDIASVIDREKHWVTFRYLHDDSHSSLLLYRTLQPGRWEDSVHLNRKDRLCLVCRSSQQVEDEHHFLFDCFAYSSIRASHASLFQCACSVSDFFDSCEANACGGFIRNCFSLRSNILAR